MGRLQEMYIMNRDGFTLLVVGFTGPKALQFKLDYINAFNAMKRQLKSLVVILISTIRVKLPVPGLMQRKNIPML
jgi:hypothetical protein